MAGQADLRAVLTDSLKVSPATVKIEGADDETLETAEATFPGTVPETLSLDHSATLRVTHSALLMCSRCRQGTLSQPGRRHLEVYHTYHHHSASHMIQAMRCVVTDLHVLQHVLHWVGAVGQLRTAVRHAANIEAMGYD